jgi:four helix bundle protein
VRKRRRKAMLRIQDDALWVVKVVYAVAEGVERKDGDLARQMRRAGASVVLNLGEGCYGRGGTRRARWHDAMGSANEVRSALLLVQAVGMSRVESALLDRLDKIVATLWKLTR